MKHPPKLRIKAPFNEYHSETWMIYVGRYKIRNIRYIVEGHWDYLGYGISCLRIYYVDKLGEDCTDSIALLNKTSGVFDITQNDSFIAFKNRNKHLIFSNYSIKIRDYPKLEEFVMRYVNADWQKRCQLEEGEVSYDQLFLRQNPQCFHIYDEKNLWKNFSGMDWNLVLSVYPQFADRCDAVGGWAKIDHFIWEYLLFMQPQFIEKFLEYMNNKDFNYWEYLILHYPQIMEKCCAMDCLQNIDMEMPCSIYLGDKRFVMTVAIAIHIKYPHLSNISVIEEQLYEWDFYDKDLVFLYLFFPDLVLSIFPTFDVAKHSSLISEIRKSKENLRFSV